MAGGVYDSYNFEQTQLKMAWSKNIFSSRSIPHKMFQTYILLEISSKKHCFKLFFNQNKRIHLFLEVFLCISASCESYLTPRWPIGVRQREWGPSQGLLSHFPICRLGVIYDSQPHGSTLFSYSHPDFRLKLVFQIVANERPCICRTVLKLC